MNTRLVTTFKKTILFTLVTLLVLPALTLQANASEVAINDTAADIEADDIVAFEAIALVIRRLPNTYFAAATGFVDPETPLPVTVEIAIPHGASIIWFGEPFEGDITDAPRFEEPYQVRRQGDLDIYTATLTQHPQVQIEFNLDQSPVSRLDDGRYMLNMEYTPLTDLKAFRFVTNLPPGSTVANEEFVFMGHNSEGDEEYGFTIHDTTAMQTLTASLVYSAPIGTGTPNETRVMDGIIVTVLVLALGIGGVLAGMFIVQRRRATHED